jgi:hypothetical protein
MSRCAKYIAALVGTVLSAVVGALTDNVITDTEWINVAIAGVGALSVFTAPNIPGFMYTKAILAALTAVLQLLVSLISDGLTASEAMQLGLAALTALGV